MADQIKKEMAVQWIVNRKDKKLIKFVESEDRTYKLADNVLEHLNSIKTNTIVNVTIEGENVVYIAVKGEEIKTTEVKKEIVSETPKQEVIEKKIELVPEQNTVKEEKSKSIVEINQNGTNCAVDFNQASGVEKKVQAIYTYKVKGYSKDLLWWLFEETGEKVWFGVDDKLIDFMKTIEKGDVLKISGESRKSRGKDVDFITYAELITKSQKNTNIANEQSNKSYSKNDNEMNKRTALMQAKDIVVSLIGSKSERVNSQDKVNDLIKSLTKICYEAITQL